MLSSSQRLSSLGTAASNGDAGPRSLHPSDQHAAASSRGGEKEGLEEPPPLREAYLQLWRVVRLPAVRQLALVLVICRLGMLTAEAAAPLKLLEKGASREALAGLVSAPLCLCFPQESVALLAPLPCPPARPVSAPAGGRPARPPAPPHSGSRRSDMRSSSPQPLFSSCCCSVYLPFWCAAHLLSRCWLSSQWSYCLPCWLAAGPRAAAPSRPGSSATERGSRWLLPGADAGGWGAGGLEEGRGEGMPWPVAAATGLQRRQTLPAGCGAFC
jgi:hypothetical protein